MTEREIIEAKLRQHDGQALGDPGHTVRHIAEQIAAALRESRKADIQRVREILWEVRAYPSEREVALAALSRLAGDE